MIIANHTDLNLSTFSEKSLSILFKTGDDIEKRQMIFEQGRSSRGLSVYVFEKYLYLCGWNIPNDDEWGYNTLACIMLKKRINVSTSYHAVLVQSANEAKIRAYVNQSALGSVSGVGKLFPHSGKIGLGGVADNTLFHDNYTGQAYFKGEFHDLGLQCQSFR